MDHRCGRGRWKQPRNLGNRRAFAPDSSRKFAGLLIPVRSGNRRAHLFRRFSLLKFSPRNTHQGNERKKNYRMTKEAQMINDEKNVTTLLKKFVIRFLSFLCHSS